MNVTYQYLLKAMVAIRSIRLSVSFAQALDGRCATPRGACLQCLDVRIRGSESLRGLRSSPGIRVSPSLHRGLLPCLSLVPRHHPVWLPPWPLRPHSDSALAAAPRPSPTRSPAPRTPAPTPSP